MAIFRPLDPSHATAASPNLLCSGHGVILRDFMQRRHFITLIGGMAAAWPLVLYAQPLGRMARIGFLGSASATGSAKSVEALRTGLRDLGYVEGRNIVIEFRWAEGKYDRLSDLVAELIRLNVDVIVTHRTPGTRTAKKATSTIPIVMAISGYVLSRVSRGPKQTS